MESSFASRVKQFRAEKQLSQTAFAERCELTQGNIAHMEGGKEPLQSNVSKLISGFPDLNPDWLLLGTGPMLRDGRTLTPATEQRPDPDPPGPAYATLPDAPTPGEATPQQADFVGRFIKRLEDELEASKGREVYWQERAEKLEKPSPAPDAARLSVAPRTEISLRPTACNPEPPKDACKVIAMWPAPASVKVAA